MRSLVATLLNKAPISYVGRGTPVNWPWTQRNDSAAQMRAMGEVGTLFAIVSRTSNATSQVEWKLWRKARSGKKEDRTEVTSHAALDLWNQPNKYMTRQELVEAGQQHVDLTGEGWLVIGRNPRLRNLPLELWPVRPDRMAPVPSVDDYIAGYTYTSPDGEMVPLERDQVLMLRMPNPLDPYRGMGPVQAILTNIDSAKYSAEWNRNFFLNSAEPGGVIEVPTRLSDREWSEMIERWREQHQGVANAHRVAVIEQGKWVNRTFSMRDMQFAELREVSRDTMLEAFGFPKFMLGAVDDVNRANAEASAAMFAQWLVRPRCERWKGMLNNDLLPLYGATAQGLEFDYENPVPPDGEAENAARDSKVKAVSTLVPLGFDADEAMEAFGLPAIKFDKPEPPPPPEPPAEGGPAPSEGGPAMPGNGAPRARAGGSSFLAQVGRFRRRSGLVAGAAGPTNYPNQPRDPDGQFSSGGGGLTGDAALAAAPLGLTDHQVDAIGRVTSKPGPGMSKEEARALSSYRERGFVKTNKDLRANEGQPSPATEKNVTIIDGAMTRSKLTGDVSVERGIGNGPGTFGDRWNSDLTGTTFVDHAFVSTTTDHQIASEFGDRLGLADGRGAQTIISVPAGTSAIKLSDRGPFQEAELLLDRGLTYEVMSDSGPGPGRKIEMQVRP